MRRFATNTYLIIILLFCSGNVIAKTYYVSSHGINTAIGTSPDHPWQTIQFAMGKMVAGDSCLVMEGVYRETVKLMNSGRENAPITLMSYHDQNVVVTGLDSLSGWRKAEGKNYWQADMTWTLGHGNNQLFYDGEVMLEARFPNIPDKELEIPVKGLSKLWPTFGNFSIRNGNTDPYVIYSSKLDNGKIGDWIGANYCGVHFEGWAAQSGIVEESDAGKIKITNPTKSWWFSTERPWMPEMGRGMLSGHILAMDSEGEWLLENNKMLFISPGNKNPEGKTEVKKRQLAFDFSDVSFVAVKGIKIKCASVCMRNATYCTMEDCDLSYISHFSIFEKASGGAIGTNNKSLENGELSVFVSGHDNKFLHCKLQYSAGGGFFLSGYNHTIHNCLINECSYAGTYNCAIFIGGELDFYAGGHVITYNTVSNCGRALLHFVASKEEREMKGMRYAASLISNNHFYNGMLLCRDGGNINSYWSDLGAYNGTSTEFCNNVLHDCYDPMGNSWGLGIIYLDNNSRNFNGHHNILWASPGTVRKDFIMNPHSENIIWRNNNLYTTPLNPLRINTNMFPDYKPFKFGYQGFEKPEIPIWNRILSFSPHIERFNKDGNAALLANLKSSNYLIAKSVDFSKNWKSISMEYSSENSENNKISLSDKRSKFITDPLLLPCGYCDKSSPEVQRRWDISYHCMDDSWFNFLNVDLGDGYKSLSIIYASRNQYPKWLELRIGSPIGKLISKVDLKYSDAQIANVMIGTLNPFIEVKVDLPDWLKGIQDLYVVSKGGNGYEVAQYSMFRLDNYKGELPIIQGERRIEMHLDSPGGERIGYMYTHFTGGKESFRKCTFNIRDSIKGIHDLYFVLKSSSEQPLINKIKTITLEKGGTSM